MVQPFCFLQRVKMSFSFYTIKNPTFHSQTQTAYKQLISSFSLLHQTPLQLISTFQLISNSTKITYKLKLSVPKRALQFTWLLKLQVWQILNPLLPFVSFIFLWNATMQLPRVLNVKFTITHAWLFVV